MFNLETEEVPLDVRQAVDFALEQLVSERPANPVEFVAAKLLEFERTHDRRRELRDLFVAFDEDSSGTMDMRELYAMGKSFCPGEGKNAYSNKAMRRLFRGMDKNGDKTITQDEFIYEMEQVLAGSSAVRFRQGLQRALVSKSYLVKTREHHLQEIFDAFDVDQTGQLNMSELYKIMRVLVPGSGKMAFTNEELRKRFGAIDANVDKKISKAEFVKFTLEVVSDPVKSITDSTFAQGVSRVLESIATIRELNEIASRSERLWVLYEVLERVSERD